MNTEFNINTKDINDKLIEELKTITDEINNDPQKSITKKGWIKQNILFYTISFIGTLAGVILTITNIISKDVFCAIIGLIGIIINLFLYRMLEEDFRYAFILDSLHTSGQIQSLSLLVHKVWNKQIIELQQKLKKEEIKDDISNRE